MNAPAREQGDRLTRTTLLVECGADAASAAALLRTLHRVPGVLIAKLDATHESVLVAHDGAVRLEALVAALEGGGIRASVAGGVPAALARVAAPSRTSTIVYITLTWLVFTAFTGIAILDPSLLRGLSLMPVVALVCFLFLFTRSFVARRP